MNEMSALAAAASDQLFELERTESVRRAEYEMRHRQIIGQTRGAGGGSPAGGLLGGGNFGYGEDRDRWGAGNGGMGGGSDFHAPGQAVHHAVGAGHLSDLSYLTPPNCHHSECHKSYRKRLRAAQRAGAVGGGNLGALTNNHSASSSASNLASNNFLGGSNVNLSAALNSFGNNGGQLTPQQTQQLQQLQAAQFNAQQQQRQGFRGHRGSMAYGLGPNGQDLSVGPSPASSVSSDELEDQAMLSMGSGNQPNINPNANLNNSSDFNFASTSPDLGSMRNMSIFPPLGNTALNMNAYAASLQNMSVNSTTPSGVNSPSASRITSRSGSPVHFDEGHGVGNKLHHQHQKHRCVSSPAELFPSRN